MDRENYYDTLIIGAGLSGIAAAYQHQKECPQRSFAILEMRENMGGTWDLFRYPGVRSDSDIYTLGYDFRPWKGKKAITEGHSILSYIKDTANDTGISHHIHYQRRIETASWSSKEAVWTLGVACLESGEQLEYHCQFLWMCSGYYNYDQGYLPKFEGLDLYRGKLIHPQKWPQDLDYTDKEMIVIGSGATAVTLVPNLAKKARKVTMLQRSPSYIVPKPSEDILAQGLQKILPESTAHHAIRWKNILIETFFYQLSQRFPDFTKRLLLKVVKKSLGANFNVEKHFTPRYNPWDQRVCLVPDGDFFQSIKSGKAEVATDHIQRFTPQGILLQSGEELKADIIVTATGLDLKFLGGISMQLDRKPIDLSQLTVYRGAMFGNIPNFALSIGYINISWTLKAGLIAKYICRILKKMDGQGAKQVTPIQDFSESTDKLINMSSGYFRRARNIMPHQGKRAPWKMHQNYFQDIQNFQYSSLEDGILEFK